MLKTLRQLKLAALHEFALHDFMTYFEDSKDVFFVSNSGNSPLCTVCVLKSSANPQNYTAL